MSQNSARLAKTAAAKLGVSVAEYQALRSAGLKHCWRCRAWRLLVEFDADRSRYDGLTASCSRCRRARPRQLPLIKETPAEYERRRYATDPTFRHMRQQRTSARRRGVDAVPLDGQEFLLYQFNGRCAYCPATATTWDHIVPVSAGGKTVPGNILPACLSCNSRKGALDIFDFIDKHAVVVTDALDDAIALALEWGQLTHG